MKPLSWRKLQAVLNQMTEAEVLAMLEDERQSFK